MAHVLVLDDEPGLCWALRHSLSDDGHRVTVASTAEQALARLADDPAEVLFVDVRLPGLDGLSALALIRERTPGAAVVVMTAYGTVETAVRAVQGGAFDYLPKPFDLSQARGLVERALRARVAASAATEPPDDALEEGTLIGSSLAMQAVFKQIAIAAGCDEPVLVTGESGTGKELVARAIHRHGPRAGEPFVPVHLAALPESLVERELFGHEKGAFTGAEQPRPGLLDRVGSGTVFFDEVGEAPASFQAKLLRVLDGGDYRPVGGGSERRLRGRIVAATNRDIAPGAGGSTFRPDLYYRLAVLRIHLPPLRDRRDDLPALWDRFVAHAGAPGGLEPGSPLARTLLAHDWPGNVRELRNVAEHAARASGGGPIDRVHLPATMGTRGPGSDRAEELDAAVAAWVRRQLDEPGDACDLHDRAMRAVERPLFRALLDWAGGNQSRMARRLGLHRSTLRLKLREHGIEAREGE